MTRRFLSHGALAALLAGMILTVPVSALAEESGQSKWNPASWFSGDDNAKEAAAKARRAALQEKIEAAEKKAEQARIEAENALKAAEAAQAEVAKLRKEAEKDEAALKAAKPKKTWSPYEAGKKKPQDKPVVNPPDNAQAQNQTPAQPPTESASKGSLWNPANWFAPPNDAGKTASNTPVVGDPTPLSPADWTPEIIKSKLVQVSTEKGTLYFELYPEEAPVTVKNFLKLVNEKFYDQLNMKFHRVIPGFVVQTGDPTGTGAGGSKERIPLEVKNKLSHNAKGVVAMARGADPNSATSQFYITLAPETSLDGKYAIFGRVVSGLDVLDKIEKGDMLYGVSLVDRSAVTPDAPTEKKGFFSGMFNP